MAAHYRNEASEEGDDLDDPQLQAEDDAEAGVENTWEDDSILADEDASTSDAASLDTLDNDEMQKRFAQNAEVRKRRGAAKQREIDDEVRAKRRKIMGGGGGGTLDDLLGDTETVISYSTRHQGRSPARTVASERRGGRRRHGASASAVGTEFGSETSDEDSDWSEGSAKFDLDTGRTEGDPVECLKRETVVREVKRQFRLFLRTFTDQGANVYQTRIKNMVVNSQSSLVVDFQQLSQFKVGLAVFAGEAPTQILHLFNEVASREVFSQYTEYQKLHPVIHVRLINLPFCDPIRALRCLHLNSLIQIHGVVTRRSLVYPQLRAVKYDCLSCGFVIGPFMQNGARENKPKQCPQCQKPGPFRLNSAQTQYRNYQTLILQETPGTIPPGRLPRWIEVIVTDDLVDVARPGDEIQVTGIFKNLYDPLMNHRQGAPVFATHMEANAVRKRVDDLKEAMTDDEKAELLALAKHSNIVEKICGSICPSIHGNEVIKAGIACSLFGGVAKEVNGGKHRMRGDINCLLLGDPGCAKSQFLKYVEKTSPRAVFTTGRGSTAVGLTAAVHRDAMTGEWTLEGGAMVIADKGHCLIDEFDKMGDQDRTSIHEAMEQQTISIAKAGIVTSLQARCSIVAAANPIMGHYDSTQTFESQVNLTQPIISRFDLLFAVRDIVDPVRDTTLAKFVINSHIRNHETSQHEMREGIPLELLDGVPEIVEDKDPDTPNPFPQKLLQRYILYARTLVKPVLENVNRDRLVKFYVDLRDDSAMKYESGVKIVVRHLESMIRISEAFAKMRLSQYVREDDVSRAISLFLNAFLSTMQHKRRETLKKKYNTYLVLEKQHHHILQHILSAAVKEQTQIMCLKYGGYDDRDVVVHVSDLQSKAREHKIYDRDVDRFFKSKLFTKQYELINNKNDIMWKKGESMGGTQFA